MEVADNETDLLNKSPSSTSSIKKKIIDMNYNPDKSNPVIIAPCSEKVKVIVRCRPISQKETAQGHTSVVTIHKERNEIEVHRPNPSSSNLANTKIDKVFTFDSVYDERTSQSDLYNDAFSGIVDSVLNGFNGTIFAYGQTGTGKTFTMEGIRDKEEYHGVIPNAFKHIFDKINNSPDRKYLVRASYLEIYQEEIRDLLFKDKLRTCELKESPDNGVYVKDLSTYLCGDYKDINELMSKGNKNRSVGATNMNEHSSRSHAIFVITIEMSEEWADGRVHFKVGKLNLVDLAGSERQGKTGSEGERLKEAVKINLSLSTLGHVIGALADGKSSHIPYRDSKLTRLLQDSLGGNSKTIMVATIGPASFNYDETMVTLRYASRAKRIKNKPKINEDPKDAMLRVYQEEISRLKAQLEAKKNQQQKAVLNSFNQDDSGRVKTGNRSRRPMTAGSESQAYLDSSLMKELAPYIEAHRLQENLDPKEILKILEEKRKSLLMDNETVKEEKERLIKKLELTQRRVRNAEEECSKLHTKIEWLESKVLNGGKSLLDHTNEQQKLIEQRKREIEEEKSKEEEIRQRILEHEMGAAELRDLKSDLEAQIEYKATKSNKIISKIQRGHNRRVERIQIHDNSSAEIRSHLTSLQRESHMTRVIIENFIPSKMKMLCEKLCQYHESDTSYTLLPITSVTFSRPPINRELRVPLYSKTVDGSFVPLESTYYSDENILQLHPLISGPTSKNYVPPDTDPYIRSLSQKAQADSEKEIVIDCSKLKTRISTARVRLGDIIALDNGQRVKQLITPRHRSREIPYKDFTVVYPSSANQLNPRSKTAVSFSNSSNNKRTGGQDSLLSPLKQYFKDNDPYVNLLRKLPRCSTAVAYRNEPYSMNFPGIINNSEYIMDGVDKNREDAEDAYWNEISSRNQAKRKSLSSRSHTYYNNHHNHN